MPNPQVIAREALKALLQEGKDPTPEAYAKSYNEQAKKLGANAYALDLSDEKILDMLDSEVREGLFSRDFKHKNEIIIALIKAVNLLFFSKKNFTLSLETIKLLLRLLATHPQKEVSTLAKGYLIEVDKTNAKSMQVWKERFMEQVKRVAEFDYMDLSRGLEFLSAIKIESLEFQKWQDRVRDELKAKKCNKEMQIKFLKELEVVLKMQLENKTQKQEDNNIEKIDKQAKKEPLCYANITSLPIDPTTTLISKDGMQEVLNYAEDQYVEKGFNYSVIVFGIAKYDKVKEIFGVEAAKKILATLGRLLKQYSNASDLIAYYGDEEFLACLLEREKEEAVKFICALDAVVQKSVFMYQQTRIEIALSAQASHRVSQKDLEDMLKVSLLEFARHKDSQGIINKEIQG